MSLQYTPIPDEESNLVAAPQKRLEEFRSNPYLKIFVYSLALMAITLLSIFFVVSENGAVVISSFSDVFGLKKTLVVGTKRYGYDSLPYTTSLINLDSKLTYKFIEDYIGILEPYAQNTFGVIDDYTARGYTYSYTVCASGEEDCSEVATLVDGEEAYFTPECEAGDEYDVTVYEYSSSGKMSRSISGKAICYYVRREFRELTEDDLSATMDAMVTLWQISDEEGQQLYGEEFHNSTYLSGMHYFGASQRNADHFHEGLGFVLQHLKMTNVFEKSIQAVNPMVSCLYWDYTIDMMEDDSVQDSFAFQENTFGSLPSAKSETWGWTYELQSDVEARIPNGRWENMTTEYNWAFPQYKTAYGYLRAPWNMNPSPYITRYVDGGAFPTCSGFYDWLQKGSLMKFLKYAPGPSHASSHGTVGGVFGCDKIRDSLYDLGLMDSTSKARGLCSKWGFKMKSLYRYGYITAYSDCEVNTEKATDSECGVTCASDMEGTMIDALKDDMSSYFKEDMTDDEWGVVKDFICDGDGYKVFYGDHLESASADDPSFWPIHPTMERLMHVRQIIGFSSDSWNTDPEADYICGRNECWNETTRTLEANDNCCLGHYENDGMLDFINQDPTSTTGYGNRDYLTMSNPSSDDYDLGYVYSSFSWSHCSESSRFDVDSEISSLIASELSDDDDEADDDDIA